MIAGRTLQSYVFLRFLRMVLFMTLGLAAMALLIDFTETSNRTGSLPQYTIAAALGISAMRLPFIVQVAFPFVVLAATIATLINLNRRYELVIARSAGMSAWQFLAPTWIAAAALGLLAALVLNPLAAGGFSLAQSIEGGWRGAADSRTLPSEDPWLRQARQGGGSVLITARQVTNGPVMLMGAVFVETGPEGGIVARHDAERAILEDGRWRLEAVQTHVAGARPIVRDRIALATDLDPAVIRQALVPAEMVSIYALPGQIAAARSFGVPASPFRMQFHSLVALPGLLVAMTLVAATVSLRFVRSGQSATMIVGGIVAGFVLYVVTALARSFGSAGVIAPVLAAWLPVVCGVLFGTAYLLHREDG